MFNTQAFAAPLRFLSMPHLKKFHFEGVGYRWLRRKFLVFWRLIFWHLHQICSHRRFFGRRLRRAPLDSDHAEC